MPTSGFEPEQSGMHSVDLMQSIFTMCGQQRNQRRIPDYLQAYFFRSTLFSHHTMVSYATALLWVGLLTNKRIQTSAFTSSICPLLTTLRVGPPWLFQPYASPDLLLCEALFRTSAYTLWAVHPLFSHFVSSV